MKKKIEFSSIIEIQEQIIKMEMLCKKFPKPKTIEQAESQVEFETELIALKIHIEKLQAINIVKQWLTKRKK